MLSLDGGGIGWYVCVYIELRLVLGSPTPPCVISSSTSATLINKAPAHFVIDTNRLFLCSDPSLDELIVFARASSISRSFTYVAEPKGDPRTDPRVYSLFSSLGLFFLLPFPSLGARRIYFVFAYASLSSVSRQVFVARIFFSFFFFLLQWGKWTEGGPRQWSYMDEHLLLSYSVLGDCWTPEGGAMTETWIATKGIDDKSRACAPLFWILEPSPLRVAAYRAAPRRSRVPPDMFSHFYCCQIEIEQNGKVNRPENRWGWRGGGAAKRKKKLSNWLGLRRAIGEWHRDRARCGAAGSARSFMCTINRSWTVLIC